MSREQEWTVSIPFADLNRLVDHLESQDAAAAEVQQLRQELEGLRGMFQQLMETFGEIRRGGQC